jgi:eukaryotic-like serine/threonine-protein kinase
VWDVATRRIEFNLSADEKGQNGHTGPVWALSLAPDGKRLVSAGEDGKVLEWDLTMKVGVTKPRLVQHKTSVRAMAVNWQVDDVWVVTGDGAGSVRVFVFGEATEQKSFDTRGSITSVAFTGDGLGMTVAAAGTDKKVSVWEVPTERLRFNPLVGHGGPVYAVASSRDGGLLASAGWDGKVVLWDSGNGVKQDEFVADSEGVLAIDFSCCGHMLATAGSDGKVKVWNADTKPPVATATFDRHKGVVHTVKFTEDGKRLFSGGRDGTVRVWEVKH